MIIANIKLNNLVSKIIQWGKDRKILQENVDNSKNQLLKLIEEIGEYTSAYSQETLNDAIGDIYVTAIILLYNKGIVFDFIDFYKNFSILHNNLKTDTDLLSLLGEISKQLIKYNIIDKHNIYMLLYYICHDVNNIYYCLSQVYMILLNRIGIIKNGVFIKNEDLKKIHF